MNAYLLYLASGNKSTQLGFRRDVAKTLLEGFCTRGPSQPHHKAHDLTVESVVTE